MAIGFFASVGLGPVTVLVLKRAIGSHFRPAFFSGLGSAVADTVFGTMAFIGSGYLLAFITDNQDVIRLVIMVILLVVAWFVWHSRPPARPGGEPAPVKMTRNFISTFTLALSNPLMVLVFLTVFSLFADLSFLRVGNWPWAMLGLFCGTTAWWLVLSRIVCRFRHRMPDFLFGHLNRISGWIIVALALYSGLTGLLHLI